MKLGFRPVTVNPPEIPGAQALGIRDWAAPAPGRMQQEIVPPGLIMATLRAFMRGTGADEPDARWLEKVPREHLAVRDLLRAAARSPLHLEWSWDEDGARPVTDEPFSIWNSGTWQSKNGLAVEQVSVIDVQRGLWRLCASAVRGDLERAKETPGDAVKRILSACAVENAKVASERARRKRLIERDLLARSTWSLPMAVCWMQERDVLRVYGCIEDLDGESLDPTLNPAAAVCRSDSRDPFGSAEQSALRPRSALLRECRQCPGLLLARRSGVDGELEAIDTRLMETAQFQLTDNEATAPGACWVGVCVDVGRLMAVAPPPAVSLIGALVDALFTFPRISQCKSSWLAEKMGGAIGTLNAEQARELASQWLGSQGLPANASDVMAEAKRLQSLARSFRRAPANGQRNDSETTAKRQRTVSV